MGMAEKPIGMTGQPRGEFEADTGHGTDQSSMIRLSRNTAAQEQNCSSSV